MYILPFSDMLRASAEDNSLVMAEKVRRNM
jgi:hypothetical protein